MTPIENIFDVRLLTLIGVAISAIEDLAVEADREPEQLLSDLLYRCNKRVGDTGGAMYIHKLLNHYPMLKEAIK
jgi:hypothetical protein